MNLAQLHQKLIAAARAHPPGDRVPYAFEKRILAHLVPAPALDVTALWARALWRAAVPCVLLTLLVAAFSFVPTNTATEENELAQTFEQTLFASADQLEESW